MITKNAEELAMRLSPIIHVLLTEDYGPISGFMNLYVEFLRNYYPHLEKARVIENDMVLKYHVIYDYLAENEDRSVALLQHLQEESILFLNGDLPIGKIEIEYEQEPVSQ
tara:strand:- start:850 stop:1179 length:330 start_codon:yes stop_codon:yes gene_type:complete